jgi:hypothetical protein
MAEIIPIGSISERARSKRAFLPGEEVHVISNPEIIMTVEKSSLDKTDTVWFDDGGTVQREQFLTVTLRFYQEPNNEPEADGASTRLRRKSLGPYVGRSRRARSDAKPTDKIS